MKVVNDPVRARRRQLLAWEFRVRNQPVARQKAFLDEIERRFRRLPAEERELLTVYLGLLPGTRQCSIRRLARQMGVKPREVRNQLAGIMAKIVVVTCESIPVKPAKKRRKGRGDAE